ncbi:MAG: hypothetical protein MZW92_31065 [Comamonadaceae bacterium]|nr:hypothetical protein [Comamonadaceae bacterium]
MPVDLSPAARDQAPDVGIIVVEPPQGIHHDPVDELELADVGRDVDVGEPVDEAVVKLPHRLHEEALLPLVL